MSSKASSICRWPSLTCALSLLVTSGSLYTPAEDTYLALCVQQSSSITEAARRFSQRVRRFALRPSLLSFLADLSFYSLSSTRIELQPPSSTTTVVIQLSSETVEGIPPSSPVKNLERTCGHRSRISSSSNSSLLARREPSHRLSSASSRR